MKPLFLALVLAATAASATTFVDDVGRAIEIAGKPLRIVSTAPSNTAALFALGAGDRVVGVTTFCDYPAAAKKLPKVGDFSTLDYERILALEPDLVVATWLDQRRHVEQLERHGLTVLVLYPASLEATMNSLLLLGRAIGAEADAVTMVVGLRKRLAVVAERVAAIDETARPRVFVQLSASPLYSAGPGSTVDEAVTLAGGRNIAADLGKPYAEFSREAVIARDPQVVLTGMTEGAEFTAATLARQVGFDGLSAVLSGRVHAIDPGLLFQQNHRLVDGLELLFELFHPVAAAAPAAPAAQQP